LNPYTRERIENWSSDFVASDSGRAFTGPVRDAAASITSVFMQGACDAQDHEPEDIEEADLKASLLGPVAKLALPAMVSASVPEVCAAFLGYLQDEGRLGGGRMMGAFVRALAPAFADAASGKSRPVVRAGAKIGPNAPCPCGSGKKYKKCCMT
jgi:hypothetical protein